MRDEEVRERLRRNKERCIQLGRALNAEMSAVLTSTDTPAQTTKLMREVERERRILDDEIDLLEYELKRRQRQS